MRIREVMTCGVETIASNAAIEDAARKMAAHNVGILPVLLNGDLVGVVTDRDLAIRAVGQGLDPKRTRVSDIMTSAVLSCNPDQSIAEACNLMERNLVRRLVVVNGFGRIEGLVSLDDLAAKARFERLSGHVLAKVAVA